MGVMTTTQTWPITGTGSGRGPALTKLALAAGHQIVATTRQSTLPIEDTRLVEIQLDPTDMQDCRSGRCGTLFDPRRMRAGVFLQRSKLHSSRCADDKMSLGVAGQAGIT